MKTFFIWVGNFLCKKLNLSEQKQIIFFVKETPGSISKNIHKI